MTSIGTLFAFMLVCAGVWIMRVRRPELPRGFTVPALPVVAMLGIVVCGAMIYGLGWTNWLRLVVWLVDRPGVLLRLRQEAQQARTRRVNLETDVSQTARRHGHRAGRSGRSCARRSRRSRRARAGRPGSRIVLVGDDPASEVYVRSKLKSAGESGLARRPRSGCRRRRRSTSCCALVERLNASDVHDGILVQSPLPEAMGNDAERAGVRRDRSGQGRGRLSSGQRRAAGAESRGARRRARRPASSRCSSDAASPIAGKHAVVIGRSDIVGKPMALLLLHRHATVTICHSRTPDLPAVAREADILVAAIGRPGFVTPDVRQARRDRRSTSA